MVLPSPSRFRRALQRGVTAVVRRALGIQLTPEGEQLRRVPDDLPRDMLFAQPLTCEVTGAEDHAEDGTARAVFRVLVRDAQGKRCPDLAVETVVTGPGREATGSTTTSMLGIATFRMQGPAGAYRAEVTDVAANALAWDREQSVRTAEVTLP